MNHHNLQNIHRRIRQNRNLYNFLNIHFCSHHLHHHRHLLNMKRVQKVLKLSEPK